MSDFKVAGNYLNLLEALQNASRSSYGIFYYSRKYEYEFMSFSDIFLKAAQMADALRQAGVLPNDKVVIVSGSSFDQIHSIFGVILAGAVPCCLPTPRLGNFTNYNEALRTFLKTSSSSFAIAEPKLYEQLSVAAGEVGLTQTFSIDQLCSSNMFIADRNKSDQAILQFSSGTTRFPKPVVLSHENILENCKVIMNSFPGRLDQHSGVSWLPLHHDMGLIGSLFTAVLAPGNITMIRPEDFAVRPLMWLRALSEQKATISPAPNFALELCIQRVTDQDMGQLDLSGWSIALIGAEAVKKSTLDRFYQKFKITGFSYSAFTPVYGLAEATLAVSFSDIPTRCKSILVDNALAHEGIIQKHDGGSSLVSVGKPLSNIQLELRNDKGGLVEPGNVGRLWIKGPSVMMGYLIDGKVENQCDGAGWLETGDLAFIFEEQLFIYGRHKDIIIINGKNIDPGYIEHAVAEIAGLSLDRRAAISCEIKSKGTESFHLFVEKTKGQLEDVSATTRELYDQVVKNTGLIPDAVSIVDIGGLPRTTSGKIKRQFTKKVFEDGTLNILDTCRM